MGHKNTVVLSDVSKRLGKAYSPLTTVPGSLSTHKRRALRKLSLPSNSDSKYRGEHHSILLFVLLSNFPDFRNSTHRHDPGRRPPEIYCIDRTIAEPDGMVSIARGEVARIVRLRKTGHTFGPSGLDRKQNVWTGQLDEIRHITAVWRGGVLCVFSQTEAGFYKGRN